MTLEQKSSFLEECGLSEEQISHWQRAEERHENTHSPLAICLYVAGLADLGRLPDQIEHQTIDANLHPEPPNYIAEIAYAAEKLAQNAPIPGSSN